MRQTEWWICCNCGWQSGVITDIDSLAVPNIGECKWCGKADRWEPTDVEPAEDDTTPNSILHLPNDEQDRDWRNP